MDVNLWEGGTAFLPDCGECKVSICPAPHKMAAHRRRAPYNMGGAFDYQCDVVNRVCYDLLVAGDTLWLALIPEDAVLHAIRTKVSVPDAVNTFTYDIVAETITLEDCGAALTTPIVLPVSLAGISVAALAAVYAPITPNLYTDPYNALGRTGIRVGIEFNTFPANGLAAFLGRIELTVVASDLETVAVADCRLNGPCVIANP